MPKVVFPAPGGPPIKYIFDVILIVSIQFPLLCGQVSQKFGCDLGTAEADPFFIVPFLGRFCTFKLGDFYGVIPSIEVRN